MMTAPLLLFAGLQLLDMITTMAAFSLGGFELNPIVDRLVSQFGQAVGLFAAKLLCLALAAACVRWRPRAITKVNYVFGAVLAWNLTMIWTALA
jgi:hypothetical protein